MSMAVATWRCLLGDNPACTADDPCFTCADAIHSIEHPDGDVDGCRQCHHATIRLSPKVGQETRGAKIDRIGWKDGNSWERGIMRDNRGQPYLKADGSFITVKEFASKRSTYTEALRRLQHERASAPTPKE